jgi:hypothetical protein
MNANEPRVKGSQSTRERTCYRHQQILIPLLLKMKRFNNNFSEQDLKSLKTDLEYFTRKCIKLVKSMTNWNEQLVRVDIKSYTC